MKPITIRLARPLDAYPPLPASRPWTVDVPVIRGEACACGSWLFQHHGESIADVVRRHRQTEHHKAWSENDG